MWLAENDILFDYKRGILLFRFEVVLTLVRDIEVGKVGLLIKNPNF